MTESLCNHNAIPKASYIGWDSTTVQQWDLLQIKNFLPSKHNTKQYGFPSFPSQKVNRIIFLHIHFVKKNKAVYQRSQHQRAVDQQLSTSTKSKNWLKCRAVDLLM